MFANDRLPYIISSLQQHLLRYGYLPRETSIIDSADLFLTKAGDQISSQLFTFQRNGREFAFRPEFTASAAKHYAQSPDLHDEVIRWQFAGPIFLDNHPINRQPRVNVGAELIGTNASLSDVETVAVASTGLSNLGLTNQQITIGHAGLVKQVLSHYELDERTQRFIINNRSLLLEKGQQELLRKLEEYLPLRDNQSRHTIASQEELVNVLERLLSNRDNHIGGRTPQDIAQRILRKQNQTSEYNRIIQAITTLEMLLTFSQPASSAFNELHDLLPTDDTIQNTLVEWQEIVKSLNIYHIDEDMITIQPELALTWDYYTGIVFEIRSEKLILATGGRYDELISLMRGSISAPAIGFAYDVNAVASLTDSSTSIQSWTPLTFFLPDDISTAGQAIRWITMLRNSGLSVRTIMDKNASCDFSISEGLLYFKTTDSYYNQDQIGTLIQDIKEFDQRDI